MKLDLTFKYVIKKSEVYIWYIHIFWYVNLGKKILIVENGPIFGKIKKRKEYLVTIVLRHLGSWEGLYIFFGMIGATYFDNFSISNIYEKICSPGYSTPGSSNNYTQTGIQK